jgi:hypothetical protein
MWRVRQVLPQRSSDSRTDGDLHAPPLREVGDSSHRECGQGRRSGCRAAARGTWSGWSDWSGRSPRRTRSERSGGRPGRHGTGRADRCSRSQWRIRPRDDWHRCGPGNDLRKFEVRDGRLPPGQEGHQRGLGRCARSTHPSHRQLPDVERHRLDRFMGQHRRAGLERQLPRRDSVRLVRDGHAVTPRHPCMRSLGHGREHAPGEQPGPIGPSFRSMCRRGAGHGVLRGRRRSPDRCAVALVV